MNRWTDLLAVFGGSAKRLTEVLGRLDTERAVVRVQIDGSPLQFKSRLLLKDDKVVFAKPDGVRAGLRAGSAVRFRLPADASREVRLEVFAPHVNLASGNTVFMCRLPTSGPVPDKRSAERFGVSHLKNVLFVIPRLARHFRMVDVSLTGCRIFATPFEAETYFPLDKTLAGTCIQAGDKAVIELSSVIPRSRRRDSVGCEFRVKEQGPSSTSLDQLIRTLERTETQRLTS